MIEIRALLPSDDRTGFSCGDHDLDRFFVSYAGQNQFKHHIGVTHLAVEDNRILGFATVTAAHIEIEDIPAGLRKKLPRYPLPVLRLARLAVDTSAQGKGVGGSLLRYVFALAHAMADMVGCIGVVVDAKQQAVSFYEKLGFRPIDVVEGASPARPEPIPMFLPLKSIPRA